MEPPRISVVPVKDQNYLRYEGPGVGLEERQLTVTDWELFGAWSRSYRRAILNADPSKALLDLGRKIHDWLDEEKRLARMIENRDGSPFIVEFGVPRDPDARMLRFLEVPWEIAANADGHLAADGRLVYGPVRRIGKPSAPSECTPYRLSTVFMAASPESRDNKRHLDYEEEERAIFQATGDLGMDLVVEESGTLRLLAETVSLGGAIPNVLHISCHGRAGKQPVLLLENEEGQMDPTTPETLCQAFGETRPRVLFASACQTGEPHDELVHSFASELVARGWPAVVGWGGGVKDRDATRFAALFYEQLSRKSSVESASAFSRHGLLSQPDNKGAEKPSTDWHLARVYLGSNGGGPACGGNDAFRQARPDSGVKEFLDAKSDVPVAGRWEFVGRRREIQKTLAALRGRDKAGVFIHGIGRQGKSSLAARVASRMRSLYGHRTAVVFGRYDALTVLSAIAETLPIRPVIDIVNRYKPEVAKDPALLEQALYELLNGPCKTKKTEDGHELRPVLLIIDDFESALVTDKPFPHPIHQHYIEAIGAMIRAFSRSDGSRSRLVFTSRHTFSLLSGKKDLADALFHLPLPPMKFHEGRKQAEAKARDRGVNPESLNRTISERIVAAAQGNPGLQDLLFRTLLAASEDSGSTRGREEALESLETMLSEMEAYLASGQAPGQEALLAFFNNLAVDRLIGLIGEGESALLKASVLFQAPVPLSVLAAVAETCGFYGGEPFGCRLCGLGLWEQFDDRFHPKARAVKINALVRARLETLTDTDREIIAKAAILPLFEAWGGEDGKERPYILDWELSRLALMAGIAEVLSHSAADAIRFLQKQFLYREAAVFAKKCLDLLADRKIDAKPDLYNVAGRLFQNVGDTNLAFDCIERAITVSEVVDESSREKGNFDYASILLSKGRLLDQKGEVKAAEAVFREAESRFQACGAKRDEAIALGDIARIMVSKGDVDEALKLHQQRIEVFDALGDRRSRAVTLGDIARIMVSKGDVDEALKLHQQRIEVFDALGDRRSRAVALGDIARIMVSKGDVDEALKLHQQEMVVYESLGDRRSRAVTLGDIARIMVSKGDVDEALKLHQQMIEVFDALGDRRERAVTLGDIARIMVSKGDVDEALKLHQQMIEVFDALGDRRSRAVTLGDIARIMVSKGDVDEALKLHQQRIEVFDALGDRRERAVTLGDIARIMVSKGDVDEALKLHQQRIEVFDALGDRRERAVTLGDIARIMVSKGDVDEALKLHQQMIEVFDALGDRRSRAVTLGDIARIMVSKGDVDEALKLHQQEMVVYESLGDRRERAVTLGDIARIMVSKGDVDEALKLHQQRIEVFDALGDRRSRAVTLGDIARIMVSKGDVDEALKLHQQMIEVFDALGDRRSRAVTLGDIARIMVSKGDVDEALKLQEERLEVNRGLGDLDGIAAAQWDMARIDIHGGNHQQAYERLVESYGILMKTGRLDGICMVGIDLGRILCGGGHREEGLEILKRSAQGFGRLGQSGMAQQANSLISEIENQNKSGD